MSFVYDTVQPLLFNMSQLLKGQQHCTKMCCKSSQSTQPMPAAETPAAPWYLKLSTALGGNRADSGHNGKWIIFHSYRPSYWPPLPFQYFHLFGVSNAPSVEKHPDTVGCLWVWDGTAALQPTGRPQVSFSCLICKNSSNGVYVALVV